MFWNTPFIWLKLFLPIFQTDPHWNGFQWEMIDWSERAQNLTYRWVGLAENFVANVFQNNCRTFQAFSYWFLRMKEQFEALLRKWLAPNSKFFCRSKTYTEPNTVSCFGV